MDGKTRITIALRKESWKWIFHVLAEFGIRNNAARGEAGYLREFKSFPNHGDFWALIQELQRQFHKKCEQGEKE